MRSRFLCAGSIVVGALLILGCTESPPPPTEEHAEEHPELPSEGPTVWEPGPGRFELSHRPVYLWLDESGEEPTINVFPAPAVTHWTQDPGRIVWVVDGKREEDEWIIVWKGQGTGTGENHWPGEKRIPRGTDEAFYTAPPEGEPPAKYDEREVAAARRRGVPAASDAVWAYEIRVERQEADGSVQTIATLDPEIIIRHP